MTVLPLSEALWPITQAEANAVLGGHYLGPITYAARFILADHDENGAVCAVAAFADPVAAHFKRKLRGCLELTRLWQSDDRRERDLEFGKLSPFVRACLEWIRRERPDCPCVFSYTDRDQGHDGFVYLAARFKLLGYARPTEEWLDRLSDDKLSPHKMARLVGSKGQAKIEAKGYDRIAKSGKITYVYPLTVTVADIRAKLGGRYAEKPPKPPKP